MRLYQHNAVPGIIPRHILKELSAHSKVLAKRLGQKECNGLFIRCRTLQCCLQRILISNEQAGDGLLRRSVETGRQLLSWHCLHLRDGIIQCGDVIDLHVDAIASIPILNKNKTSCRHPCLQGKMSPVVIPGRVVIADAVQAVLHRMIADPVSAEVIPDGIRIAEYIDILIFPKIHRDIRLLQSGELPAKFHAVDKILWQGTRILLQWKELRKEGVGLLIKPEHLFKDSAFPRAKVQIAEVIRHLREHQRRAALLLLGEVQLLEAGDVYMIEGMANVNSLLWHGARILSLPMHRLRSKRGTGLILPCRPHPFYTCGCDGYDAATCQATGEL